MFDNVRNRWFAAKAEKAFARGDQDALARAEQQLRELTHPGELNLATPANIAKWRSERGLPSLPQSQSQLRARRLQLRVVVG